MISLRTSKQPQWKGQPLQAVLLDLDGTLMDTADDIATVLNQALAEHRLGSLATGQVREMIGRGVPILIERALKRLGHSDGAFDKQALLERFDFHYGSRHMRNECNARVYPGVAEGLAKLHALGLRLAVVTNKKRIFALSLLEQLGLAELIDLVVGGDSCERRKPDPQPLQFACESLHVDPAHALMVGDSINDVLAARAAGMTVVCVPYGYNEGNDPRGLACDAFIETLADLPALLQGGALTAASAQ
jgi:phosphoglycolate phosphatase